MRVPPVRPLLAAAAVAAAAVPAASAASPRAETLYNRPHAHIEAFAQDGHVVAWFERRRSRCNTVWVAQLNNALRVGLPSQQTRNVTCRWQIAPPTRLALSGTTALWTLRERGPLPFDWLVSASATASAAGRVERRFQELAHTNRGAGLWLGSLAGDTSTLAYAVTSVDYVDEAGCLAGTDSCAMEVVPGGGGVFTIAGSGRPRLVPGTARTGAVAVAVSGDVAAYVPTGAIGKDGRPEPAADLPVQVVDAKTGSRISSVIPQGTPRAVALSQHILATLEQTPIGLRLAWYVRATGEPSGSIPVPARTSWSLTCDDRTIVFHVGRSIRAVDVATHRVRWLVRAAGPPIGLSLQGTRLAWAENLRRGARIRALPVARGA